MNSIELSTKTTLRRVTVGTLTSLALLSCGRGPPKALLDEYGQVEYAQFDSPIHPDPVHTVPGLYLWRITPFKSALDHNFVVGTTDDGKVVESPAIFLKLYKHDMSATQAAELSIEILDDTLINDVRHALKPKPRSMIGSSEPLKKWIEPPRFEAGGVVYWTDAVSHCYEVSTNLTTGVLTRTPFSCRAAPDGGLGDDP